MNDTTTPWWRNRTNLPFAVFLAIGGYFLWTEHQAHVIAFLPWLLLLGCVGMHLLMHGGHSHGSGRRNDGDVER
jgi:multisubunit Na+/H+ antiporter MnhG subunit